MNRPNPLPPGALIVTPCENEPLHVAAGHIDETGADVVTVTIRDADRAPVVVILHPALAGDLGRLLVDKASRFQQQNGDDE